MSAVDWAVTVTGLFGFAAASYVTAASAGARSWAASTAGRRWTRRVGVLAAVVGGVAAGSFSVSPPGGVVLFAAGGVLGFAAAVLAAVGAAGVAVEATGRSPSFARRVRAFWYAASVEFRVTRYALVVSLVAFVLAALAGSVAVDPVVSAVGAFAFGGVVASVLGLAVVGVFVPGSRNERVADDVNRAT